MKLKTCLVLGSFFVGACQRISYETPPVPGRPQPVSPRTTVPTPPGEVAPATRIDEAAVVKPVTKRPALKPLPVRFDVEKSAHAELWQGFAKWKLGDKPCMAEEVEKLIKKTPVDQRGEMENALVWIVGSADATIESRRFSCRMLQRIGTDRCVPVLARLLTDEKLSHYARLALQRMTDSAEAGSALTRALGRAPDALKPGIIGSIAERRDGAATSGLARLVTGANAEVAAAALNALGKIGGRQSLGILQRAQVAGAAKSARLNALLLCAEGLEEAQATGVYRSIYQSEKSDTHRAAALAGLARTDPREAASIMVELLKGTPSRLRRAALGCVVMSK
ncbi:MAG: hypothetical protein ACYSU0_15760, partial [Planctomycetota bacterium]